MINMWYVVDIIVKQNKNFYDQEDTNGKKVINNIKIDRTKYHFKGNLGYVFESIETKEPTLTNNLFHRTIFDINFEPYMIEKIGFRKYKINWHSSKLQNYEDIAIFYYNNMLKQIPSRTKLDCFKDCLEKQFINKENIDTDK